MGGAKKRSLAQGEKQQKLQKGKQQKEKKTTAKRSRTGAQLKKDGATAQEIIEKDFDELAKIKVLTPYTVAKKYNIKINESKKILEMLEEKRTIQEVARSSRLKVYKFIGNA